MMPYRPYEYQKVISRDESNLIVVNKARQIGISTNTVLDVIHRALLRKGYTCLFVSARQDQAEHLINKARMTLACLNERFSLKLKKDQAGLLEFPNGARIKAVSARPSAVRTFTGDLVFDEFAFVLEDRAMFQAAMQITVLGNLRVRMVSTPYGNDNVFAEICKGAKEGSNNWSYHEIKWQECPNLTYERVMDRCPTDEIYKQEYCCEFLDETSAMITWNLLDKATDKNLRQYSLSNCPLSTNPRFIGIDPGEKVNETGFVITERINNEWFVRFANAESMNLRTLTNYAGLWKDVCKPTRIYVDSTGMGAPIASELEQELGVGLIEPINLSSTMKEKLVYNLVGLFEANLLHIPKNDKLKAQLHALRREKTLTGITKFSGKGEKGKNDDLVWATALALSHNMLSGPSLKVTVQPVNSKPYRQIGYGGRRGRGYGRYR